MKRMLALLLAVLLLTPLFSACTKDDDEPSRVVPDATNPVNMNNDPNLNINNSWSDNYYAMFTYYCPAQGYDEAVVITERKTSSSFIISNPIESSFKYYTDTEQGVEEYAVNPSAMLFSYNLYEGKTVNADVNSMYMKISYVTENFTSGPDVIYTGSEVIADRNCWMYLQRTYNDIGEVKEVAYIWIDSVYGFCTKCITYSGGNVVMSWELKEFSVGNVTDDQIRPDLSAYTFNEQG